MKEILVITGWYLPYLSANGACLDAVLKEYHKKGYYAHVVSFAKEDIDYTCEYCTVYPVTYKRHSLKPYVIDKISSAFEQLRDYPLLNKHYVKSVYEKCVQIIEKNPIEMVLCVQWPASSGYIGCQLKKQYPDKKYILYALDSLTDNINNYQSWRKHFSNRTEKLEKDILDSFDLMMYLACHKVFYETPKYNQYRDKLVPVDVPLIEKDVYCKSRTVANNETKKLVYSGILLKETRNPDFLIKLFRASIEKGLEASLHFYSRGDCEEVLADHSKTDFQNRLFAHGYVSKDELDRVLGGSDVLISIGNPKSEKVFSMPSKFLYYMSLGKPILHIAPDKYDMCIPYLSHYPKALVVYEDGDFAKNVSDVIEFVRNLDGNIVDFDLVEEIFKENTPAYTAKMMEL